MLRHAGLSVPQIQYPPSEVISSYAGHSDGVSTARPGQQLRPKIDALHRLFLPFTTGVMVFTLRHRLPISLFLIAGLSALALRSPVPRCGAG
jgi:hypothetical protein